jgi:ABC-type proline/glycine betaine transport system permease subunit
MERTFVFLATATVGFSVGCGGLSRFNSRVVVRNGGLDILHAALTIILIELRLKMFILM